MTVTHNQRAKRRLIRVARFCFQVYMDVVRFIFLPSHIHSFCSVVLVSCKIYHQVHAEETKFTKQSQNFHYAHFERIEMNMNTILFRSVIVCFRYQMNWIVLSFLLLLFGLKHGLDNEIAGKQSDKLYRTATNLWEKLNYLANKILIEIEWKGQSFHSRCIARRKPIKTTGVSYKYNVLMKRSREEKKEWNKAHKRSDTIKKIRSGLHTQWIVYRLSIDSPDITWIQCRSVNWFVFNLPSFVIALKY